MFLQSYDYDVAFSFLARDEPIANQLNDLVQERLKTFLYSKHQEEIAGTDGEKAFNEVFGDQARIVVVLYRSGWGKTAWTRIEVCSFLVYGKRRKRCNLLVKIWPDQSPL